jgi:polysaccharide deacetylase family protein (PEP-CTERM system associated)
MPTTVRTEHAPLGEPPANGCPRHAFTVDVEDWYQSCIDYDAPISERVVRNVERLVDVLDQHRVKGTFFVQGMVAEAFPRMVGSLVAEGHEVQAHGYSHRPLHRMTPAELRDELDRSKRSVEDAAGMPVTAFRAQDFSILERNLWALETLVDVGFEVDSSIFPMRSRHYGIASWRRDPHYVVLESGARILEVPVAVWSAGPFRVPVAGGGYVRMLPPRLIERGLRGVDSEGRPAILYCHPYEFSTDELRGYHDVPARTRFAQGLGRRSFPARVHRLLEKFSFGRFSDVLAGWGLR